MKFLSQPALFRIPRFLLPLLATLAFSVAQEAPTSEPAAATEEAVPAEASDSGESPLVVEPGTGEPLLSKEALTAFITKLGPEAKPHLVEEGYAEILLVDGSTSARAGLIVTDLLGAPEKIDGYVGSGVMVADFPASTASNLGNETDVLVSERFQIKLRSESTKFDEAMRIAWLKKHRATLKELGGAGSGVLSWLVPTLLLLGALFLLGLFWVAKGKS